MPLRGNGFPIANIYHFHEKRYTMDNILTYEEAVEIYALMQDNLDRTDGDVMEIYNRMLQKAVRYATTRAEWHMLTREEKLERDESRSMLHDSFISSINIIARAEGEIGTQWRERLTDDRKRIGDFACYVALFLAIDAR